MSKPTPRPQAKLVPYPDEVRTKARQLFLVHTPFNDIAKQLSVSTSALAKWRGDEGWVAEREALDDQLQFDLVSKRKIDLTTLVEAGVKEIKRAIKRVTDAPDGMTIQEAEKMGALVTMLHKVSQLDNKLATENVAVNAKMSVSTNVSIDKIREIVLSDQFLSPDPSK